MPVARIVEPTGEGRDVMSVSFALRQGARGTPDMRHVKIVEKNAGTSDFSMRSASKYCSKPKWLDTFEMRKPMERNELARSPDISRSLGEKNMVTGIQNSNLSETVHTV